MTTRLPTVGGDSDAWGSVLNDYLTQNVTDRYTLSAASSAAASSVTLDKDASGILAGGTYVAVGATTTKCEVRRVTAVSGATLTLDTDLVYAHSPGDFVWVVNGTLVPLEWFGCKANDSTFDSFTGLQQAFNDIALTGQRAYGLTGHGARYYTKTPVCVYDNTPLDRMVITAKSPMSIDLTTGLDRLGTAGQYHVTLGGQFGTVTGVTASSNELALSTSAGSARDRLIFYAAQGDTLPSPLEAGRHYFITGVTGSSYTISEDYDGTNVDITDAGSGTIYFYSPGVARMLWDFVTFEGGSIAGLNGVYAALQQPSVGRNIRIDSYAGAQGATTFFGQQAEFYNLVIVSSTIGLNCQGMEFLHIFGGNFESNGTGMQTFGIDPAGTSTADRDIQLHGIHWEANTDYDVLAGDNLIGLGIYGGVTSSSCPFFTVNSTQVLGYSIQNFSSIANTGTAIDDGVRGITLDWDDSVEDGVAGQIANFVAPMTHGLNPSKSWWLVGNGSGANAVVWDAHNNDFRLNGTGTKIRFGDTGPMIRSGSGSPESSVTAPIGSMYLRTDGGSSTTLYVKESGTGNTGWVAK